MVVMRVSCLRVARGRATRWRGMRVARWRGGRAVSAAAAAAGAGKAGRGRGGGDGDGASCSGRRSSDLEGFGPAARESGSVSASASPSDVQRRKEQDELSAAAHVDETRALVEGGMMAAVGGLMYFGSLLLRVDAHVASLYPLPAVLMSLRWNAGAAARCVAVTTLLLCVVAGPLRALTYFFMNGMLALVLGACWRRGVPWLVSVFACAISRSAGICGAIVATSLLMSENLAAIFVANVTSVLENVHASLAPHLLVSGRGAASSAIDIPPGAVYVCAGVAIFLNSLVYCLLLHLLYAIVLKLMGSGAQGNVPTRVKRWLLSKTDV